MFKRIFVESIKSVDLDINLFIKLFEDGFNINLEKIKNKIDKMKNYYKNNQEIDVNDLFSNDFEEIFTTPKYFFNICCVMLYSGIEIKLKNILENIYEYNTKGLFKYHNMDKAYRINGIKLKNIECNKIINELRLVNNCIKHDGYISRELEKVSKKKFLKGNEINISKENLIEYSKSINCFINGLYRNVKTFLLKQAANNNR